MATINIDEYPQLATICWNRKIRTVEEAETLTLYEAGWRFVEKGRLTTSELDLINKLAEKYGNGVLNV